MELSVVANISLNDPDVARTYTTWFDVTLRDDDQRALARARVGVLHVGEAADAEGDLWSAMHRTPLESLHETYFAHGWYKDDFATGAGIDLLFFDSIMVEPEGRARNVDLALIRRLCDTLGSSCQLAVTRFTDAHQAAHWSQLGFAVSTPGRTSGLMHLQLGYRHARVVDPTGCGEFEVQPEGGFTFMRSSGSLAEN